MDHPVLTLLSDIGKTHERIVELANQLDWDGVNDEWKIALQKLLVLRTFPLDQLSGQEREEAIQHIRKLLELEERISGKITPWLEQVRPLLESFDKYPPESGKSNTE